MQYAYSNTPSYGFCAFPNQSNGVCGELFIPSAFNPNNQANSFQAPNLKLGDVCVVYFNETDQTSNSTQLTFDTTNSPITDFYVHIFTFDQDL